MQYLHILCLHCYIAVTCNTYRYCGIQTYLLIQVIPIHTSNTYIYLLILALPTYTYTYHQYLLIYAIVAAIPPDTAPSLLRCSDMQYLQILSYNYSYLQYLVDTCIYLSNPGYTCQYLKAQDTCPYMFIPTILNLKQPYLCNQ
jgi:hypothetical protein